VKEQIHLQHSGALGEAEIDYRGGASVTFGCLSILLILSFLAGARLPISYPIPADLASRYDPSAPGALILLIPIKRDCIPAIAKL
jgi:hypothetical protein